MENKALDKNVRYDRQLRLWGQQGQDGLQAARIGVLHSSATSAEVLKNLVLPGTRARNASAFFSSPLALLLTLDAARAHARHRVLHHHR